MTKNELGPSDARGDQLLQPQRGWGQSPRELGHESNARLLNSLAKLPGLGWIVDVQGCATVDALAVVTGRQHRQGSIPLRGQNHDHIDVVPRTKSAKSVHFA